MRIKIFVVGEVINGVIIVFFFEIVMWLYLWNLFGSFRLNFLSLNLWLYKLYKFKGFEIGNFKVLIIRILFLFEGWKYCG